MTRSTNLILASGLGLCLGLGTTLVSAPCRAAAVPSDGDGDGDDDEEEEGEETITLAQAPGPVQATIKRVVGGNPIQKVEKEAEKGQFSYEAEYKVGVVEHAVKVAADGQIIEIEKKLAPGALPDAVKKTLAARHPGLAVRSADALYLGGKLDAAALYEVDLGRGKGHIELRLKADGTIVP